MNKKSLVVMTGASSKLGSEMAVCFNDGGYHLLILDEDVESVKKLPLDFSSVVIKDTKKLENEQLVEMISYLEKQYGRTEVYINV